MSLLPARFSSLPKASRSHISFRAAGEESQVPPKEHPTPQAHGPVFARMG